MTYDPYESIDLSATTPVKVKEDGEEKTVDAPFSLVKSGLVLDGTRHSDPLFDRFKSSVAWRNEIWYEGSDQVFTVEECEDKTRAMIEENEAALELVFADGFVPFPLWVRDLDGVLVEKTAYLPPTFEPSCTEGFFERHGMETNIYVPSYERAGTAPTPQLFDRFGVKNYYLCIDPSQYAKYKEHYPQDRLLIRDISFRDPQVLEGHSSLRHPWSMAGHAPLCNFTLALSRSLGESHFSFADDDFVNLAMKAKKGTQSMKADEIYDKDGFYRCSDLKEEYGFDFQGFWHNLERVIKMMRNPGFVGLERFGTVFSLPVCFRAGTRVYSFYLTANATQIAHEGRQNNDVQTSISLSRHGLVNVLAEGICYNSAQTQSGGGQTELYQAVGTFDKGKVLVRAQPAITKITDRYSRIHHSGSFIEHNKLPIVPAPTDRWSVISQDDMLAHPRPKHEPLDDETYEARLMDPIYFSGSGPDENEAEEQE